MHRGRRAECGGVAGIGRVACCCEAVGCGLAIRCHLFGRGHVGFCPVLARRAARSAAIACAVSMASCKSGVK